MVLAPALSTWGHFEGLPAPIEPSVTYDHRDPWPLHGDRTAHCQASFCGLPGCSRKVLIWSDLSQVEGGARRQSDARLCLSPRPSGSLGRRAASGRSTTSPAPDRSAARNLRPSQFAHQPNPSRNRMDPDLLVVPHVGERPVGQVAVAAGSIPTGSEPTMSPDRAVYCGANRSLRHTSCSGQRDCGPRPSTVAPGTGRPGRNCGGAVPLRPRPWPARASFQNGRGRSPPAERETSARSSRRRRGTRCGSAPAPRGAVPPAIGGAVVPADRVRQHVVRGRKPRHGLLIEFRVQGHGGVPVHPSFVVA